jgi:hypothetical protein
VADLGARLAGKKGLIEQGLRQRVVAILAGAPAADDFKALFLDLRFRSRGRKRFRDMADYIAHREVRDRGMIAELVRDIFVSARVFMKFAMGDVPSSEEARAAGHANLRLVTDRAIAQDCAMSRKAAEAAIDRAAAMLDCGLLPSDRDKFVFNRYANRVKWHPAFYDHELLDEFVAVLLANKLLLPGEERVLRGLGERLTLYILSLLHGSEIALSTNERVVLQAGFFNEDRWLEVKAYLTFSDLGKPIYMPLCVFLTGLRPEGRCDAELLASEAHGWDMPITVDDAGMLCVDR